MLSSASLLAQTKKVVASDGSGDFTTVQAAIDAVPDSNTKWITIYIENGIYKETITISTKKSFVKLIGETMNKTIITFDNYASKKDSKG
jgi:pectinesterase